jgi:hypothetical protein
VFEAQDVVDLRAAPAIDRLIVVADAADVFGCLPPLPVYGERAGVRGGIFKRDVEVWPLTLCILCIDLSP